MSKLSVDIGKLNRRITLQRRTITEDDAGNQQQEWSNFHSCWAAVNGVANREYWKAREQHEENIVSFKIRWCHALNALNKTDFRIVFDGSVYDIVFIDNVLFADSLLNIKGVETV